MKKYFLLFLLAMTSQKISSSYSSYNEELRNELRFASEPASNVINALQNLSLHIPQLPEERLEGIEMAEHDAQVSGIFWGIGSWLTTWAATTTILNAYIESTYVHVPTSIYESSWDRDRGFCRYWEGRPTKNAEIIALAAASIAVGVATWLKVRKNATNTNKHNPFYTQHAPLNTRLQALLTRIRNYDNTLLNDLAQATTLSACTDILLIHNAHLPYPYLNSYENMLHLTSFLKEISQEFNEILKISKVTQLHSLRYTEEVILFYIQALQKTEKALREIVLHLKSNPRFTQEVQTKRQEEIYKADLARIEREIQLAQAQAHKDEALAKQAQANADLANQEWWSNLWYGRQQSIRVTVR